MKLLTRRRSRYILAVVFFGLLCSSGGGANAFSGARALGMGGAFTAVADDAAAVFWNPAGLMQQEAAQVAGNLGLALDKDDSYDCFLTYIEPDRGYGAGALSWKFVRSDPGAGSPSVQYSESHYFIYSLAKPVGRKVFWGGNVRYERHQKALSHEVVAGWSGDIAALIPLSPQVNIGVTVRDVYRAVRDEAGNTVGKSCNVLAGLAYRPDSRTVIAVDGYDVLNRLETSEIRLGLERWLEERVALRLGLQKGVNTTREAWTFGVGLHLSEWQLDYAYLGGDYNGVHTLGASWRF